MELEQQFIQSPDEWLEGDGFDGEAFEQVG